MNKTESSKTEVRMQKQAGDCDTLHGSGAENLVPVFP